MGGKYFTANLAFSYALASDTEFLDKVNLIVVYDIHGVVLRHAELYYYY